MTFIDIRPAQRQSHVLSPRLQHAARLLQMSSLDFAAMVRDTLAQNPFLEPEDGDDGDVAAGATDGSTPSMLGELDSDTGTPPGAQEERDATALEGDGDASDRDLWQTDMGSSPRRAEDGELSTLDMMPMELSLSAHLHTQINVLALGPRDQALARTLIESLDDDGYLRCPLEELLALPGLQPPATLQEMQIALRHVQALDPAGVGARSVAECLKLQLPAIACPRKREMADTIVSRHLPALALRDVQGLARALGEGLGCVEEVCDAIRRLDPRPGWRFGSTAIHYVVPDVTVRKQRGQWQVQLNPAVVPKVRLNQIYATLFQRHRNPQHGELGQHLQEARWTLRNVEQRFSTILDVAEAIVKRQRNFLDYGPMAMKPLGLKEIADEIGVHESTVSRVTNNKYIATPVGVFELKYFFSRAMISSSGRACSGTAIRSLIKDIIGAESNDNPLSDAEITRQLQQQGLVMARRTVTKYRQMLKIDAVERRRRHAP